MNEQRKQSLIRRRDHILRADRLTRADRDELARIDRELRGERKANQPAPQERDCGPELKETLELITKTFGR